MNQVIAIAICVTLSTLVVWALYRFSSYAGRRAAQAEQPGEFFTASWDRWLAILLFVTVSSLFLCLAMCLVILRMIGGIAI